MSMSGASGQVIGARSPSRGIGTFSCTYPDGTTQQLYLPERSCSQGDSSSGSS
jgi:hypothetical protein